MNQSREIILRETINKYLLESNVKIMAWLSLGLIISTAVH